MFRTRSSLPYQEFEYYLNKQSFAIPKFLGKRELYIFSHDVHCWTRSLRSFVPVLIAKLKNIYIQMEQQQQQHRQQPDTEIHFWPKLKWQVFSEKLSLNAHTHTPKLDPQTHSCLNYFIFISIFGQLVQSGALQLVTLLESFQSKQYVCFNE